MAHRRGAGRHSRGEVAACHAAPKARSGCEVLEGKEAEAVERFIRGKKGLACGQLGVLESRGESQHGRWIAWA
jgi:hypothetical protein